MKTPKEHFVFYAGNCNIVQVGCGGTGSLLVPYIARVMNSPGFENISSYTLVDGDKVTSKNIQRQNFVNSDIGKFKAEVLAKRYSLALGVEIAYMPIYVAKKEILDKISQNRLGILVSCVDNNKTRKIIADWQNNNAYSSPIWIDAGNELLGGQIFIQGSVTNGIWTSILKVHPEIAQVDDKLPTELGCAERLNSGEQSLGVNATAANVVFNVVCTLLRNQKLHYYEVDFTAHNSFRKKFLDDWRGENEQE